jgi:hypothetical protein
MGEASSGGVRSKSMLVGESGEKGQVARCGTDIQMDGKETGGDFVGWIRLAHDKAK